MSGLICIICVSCVLYITYPTLTRNIHLSLSNAFNNRVHRLPAAGAAGAGKRGGSQGLQRHQGPAAEERLVFPRAYTPTWMRARVCGCNARSIEHGGVPISRDLSSFSSPASNLIHTHSLSLFHTQTNTLAQLYLAHARMELHVNHEPQVARRWVVFLDSIDIMCGRGVFCYSHRTFVLTRAAPSATSSPFCNDPHCHTSHSLSQHTNTRHIHTLSPS